MDPMNCLKKKTILLHNLSIKYYKICSVIYCNILEFIMLYNQYKIN